MATWLHKRGHRNCTGHLAACTWCSVQERYCTGRQGGRLKMMEGGQGVPYNSFAPPSHSIIWRWGLALTTYNSPRLARPGDKRDKKKDTRQLSMEAWFQSFLSRLPSLPGVRSVCGQGPQ